MTRKNIILIASASLLIIVVGSLSFYLITKFFLKTDSESNQASEVKLTAQSIKENGIQTAIVAPRIINRELEVVGKISLNRDAMAYIYPRYAGMVKALNKNLGQNVQADEVLATIESNESLQSYAIHSPIAGTITKKNAIQGELVKEDKPIYEIANLDTIWVDLSIYCKDISCIQVGQPVVISANDTQLQSAAKISYVAPIGIEDNQTMLARVVLQNTERRWIPGMYVSATIVTEQKRVPIAVNRGAIQKIAGQPTIFIQHGNIFKAVPVKLGLAGKDFIEIVSGLKAGQHYVNKNSFILKAELGKNEIEDED